MSDITDEVDKAIEALGLVPEVRRLPDVHERLLYSELVGEFLSGKDRRWWWEAFTKPSASVLFSDSMGFKHIPELVPSATEPCWFMVEDSESDTYPIYEATPELASKIIGECFAFEYYLIAKDKRWFLCENHHGLVIGIGPDVVEAINHVTA
jgi:hypothetical protein